MNPKRRIYFNNITIVAAFMYFAGIAAWLISLYELFSFHYVQAYFAFLGGLFSYWACGILFVRTYFIGLSDKIDHYKFRNFSEYERFWKQREKR
jgi:hypothetical protein